MNKAERTRREMNFAQCRAVGHLWHEVPAEKTTDLGWYFWHRCERCDMLRMDTINIRGELARRSYRQPEGYKASRNSGMTKADYRLIILKSRPQPRKKRRAA